MNAKLPLWTAIVQFLPVKALVCVYIDLASPKITKFTGNKFFAKRHLRFFVFVTFIMGIGH